MRIWHKDLIPLLPTELLGEQWKNSITAAEGLYFCILNDYKTKRILDYPLDHFYTYQMSLVFGELTKRDIAVSDYDIFYFNHQLSKYCGHGNFTIIDHNRLFEGWHSTRYLQQNLLMLEEMYDNDVFELKDWFKILNGVKNMSVLCDETYQTLFT